jgi:tetratricopeptide (TPR) repeat protein
MATAAPPRPRTRVLPALSRPTAPVVLGAGLALVLSAIGLRGGGGVSLGPTTAVEVLLQLAGGVLAAGAVLLHDGRRVHGGPALVAFGLLAALTAVSVTWAVEPSDAWLEASRALAYLAVFAAGVVLAREAGALWTSLLGAVLTASVVVSGFAVLTKVLPGVFAPDEVYARLREPYDYWNAVGLSAALGVPIALWLGARRHGHAALNAAAYPILALQLVTILLAYSRGALLAAVIGAGLWFALVPLRLRGAAVLGTATLGTVPLMAYAFAQSALTEDRVPLDLRESAGLELGLALVFMLLVLLAAGLGIGFLTARRAPREGARRTAGTGLLVVLALVPVAFVGQLALSDRGLGGSLSDGWEKLTDPDATTPANEPGRLTSVGSVRAAYWDQGFKIWGDHRLEGVGAGGYPTARRRYREDELVVRHAHGYLVQTVADLGWLGLVANALLLAAFLAAALRALALRPVARIRALVARDARRGPPAEPWTTERIGLATAFSVVVVFGFHSFVDWTWFTPGTAVPALLCAGWLAGRGPARLPAAAPVDLRPRLRSGIRSPLRAAAAGGTLLVALSLAWATMQPYRAVQAGDEAIDALDGGRTQVDRARELAQTARDRNPLSVQPLFELSVIEVVAGRRDAARKAIEDAVALQPGNPETWVRAAEFALRQDGRPQRAIDLLGPALFLDPRSDQAAALYLEAARKAGGTAGVAVSPGAGAPAPAPGAAGQTAPAPPPPTP